MRRAAPALMLALGACAQQVPQAPQGYRPPPPPSEPFRTVTLAADHAAVRAGLERVGATCWLDAELQAANMLVDRQSGDVTFFTDAGKILTADIVVLSGASTEVRLIGAAIEAPGRFERMHSSLGRTVASGAPAC